MDIADRTQQIIRESNPSINHFDYPAVGRFTYLALQHRMGLLSERRIGFDRHHTPHSSLDASVNLGLEFPSAKRINPSSARVWNFGVTPSTPPA